MGYGGSYGGEEAQCKRRGGEKWGQRALAWEMGWVLGLSVPGHTEQVPDAVLGLAEWAGTGCVGTRKHGTGVRVKVPGYGAVLGLRWELGRGPGLPEPGSAVRVSGRWAHGWRAGSVPLRAVPVPLSGRCAGAVPAVALSSAPSQRSAARCSRRGPAAMRDPTAALGGGQPYRHRRPRGGSRRREWGRAGRGALLPQRRARDWERDGDGNRAWGSPERGGTRGVEGVPDVGVGVSEAWGDSGGR